MAAELTTAPRPCIWWTPEEDRAILAGRMRGLTYRQIGMQVGRSEHACSMRYHRLSDPNWRMIWTRDEENRLIALLEAHVPWQEVARLLGRSQSGCQDRGHVLGVNFRSANGYTLSETRRLMGVDHKTLEWWGRLGLLRVQRTRQPTGQGYFGFVDHDDLLAFLGDEACWHYWQPERITDLALREWAAEQRRGLVFYTTTEAARLLYMTPLGVQTAIREGRLRGVKRGPVWLIRSDWLREPTRASCAGRAKAPPFSEADKAVIARWWGKRPATWISHELGRGTDTGIHAVARRLGLPRLGRGYWKRQMAVGGH